MKTMKKLWAKIMLTALSVVSAVNLFAISAFAEGEADAALDTVTSAMTSQLTSLVSKLAVAIAGIVGVALTIFAIKWVVVRIKSFFSSVAK